ncbi:DUF2726 domain-containing protein [Erwinia amylovora]|uniref:DUF2726 domain-containing protein n=1 Tax=Erwinia amylovora TaxID=552 RepID=UPI0020BD9BDE|nr:DUF2726 domain-containing protein [Erwinia amylovora]MCK8417630.1 DUF2726 domain-containing protein [Erwinia amylovora]
MNVSEGKVYDAVTALVARYGFPVRIFPQVSLGEILKSKDRGAFFSVNSKRVDFVIADMKNAPFAVLEFQGAGHYQNHAEKRDLIKKTACEKAGITYWEIKGQYSEEAISPLMEYLMSLYGQPSSSH